MTDEGKDTGPEPLGLLSGLKSAAPPENYKESWDRLRDFRAVFLGSQQGQRVLYHILDHCGLMRTPVQRTEAGADVPLTFRAIGFVDHARWLLRTLTNEPRDQPGTAMSEENED